MDVISRILSTIELKNAPPVLIDLGASGQLHSKWKKIARQSICIAFDADSRELGFTEKESDRFKRLLVFNAVVTDQPVNEIDFYLTKSPFCSSSLEPDFEKLQGWSFQELFRVEKKVKMKAIRLMDALHEAKIETIDWFKADTQGTDLRIFKSLSDGVRANVIMAELEPGILDAYKGEDKLYDVLQYMEESGYYMCDLRVNGTQRVEQRALAGFSRFMKRGIQEYMRISPGWAEVSYLNPLLRGSQRKRSYLLAILFAFIERQYGFALEIAERAQVVTQDSIFVELREEALRKMNRIGLGWPRVAVKSVLKRFLSLW